MVAWFGSDLRAGHCAMQPGVEKRDKSTNGATWSVAGVDARRRACRVAGRGRPAFGGTPSDDSVRASDRRAEGARAEDHALSVRDDGHSGRQRAARSVERRGVAAGLSVARPHHLRSGAGAAGLAATALAAAATQVDDFLLPARRAGIIAAWSCIMPHLAASAGGVDAFLIGSELRGADARALGAGVYPAVDALVTLAADVKAIVGAATIVTYGADWTEYGAHVVDADAHEVRFPLDPLWASRCDRRCRHRLLCAAGRLARRRRASRRALTQRRSTTATISPGICRGGEGYDWYYADDAARAAQTRTDITDGLGKPWMFRARIFWNWWSQPHYERVGDVELATPTAWMPQSKPIWFTEVGCPAVDKGANQPSVFPDPKSSENQLPYFSNGARDDLIQRRYLEAVLAAFDPAFGATTRATRSRRSMAARMIDVSRDPSVDLGRAALSGVSRRASISGATAPNWQTGHWLTGRLGGAPLDALVGALLADAGVADVDTAALRDGLRRLCGRPADVAARDDRAAGDGLCVRRHRGRWDVAFHPARRRAGGRNCRRRSGVAGQRRAVAIDARAGNRTAARGSASPSPMAARLSPLGGDLAPAGRRRGADRCKPSSRSSPTMPRRRGAPKSGCRIYGRDARARNLRSARPLALAPGDVIALTIDGRRRLFEIGDLVDTEARAASRRAAIDPEVFSLPLRRRGIKLPAMPPALGPAQATVLDLPTLDASRRRC